MTNEWTERPETGAVWHFGVQCSEQYECTPVMVAVNRNLWLEFFRFDQVVAMEPWDSGMMHWPGKRRGEPR